LVQGKQHNLEITANHDTTVLNGPLWDGTPGINIKAESYLDSVQESYKRSDLNNTLHVDIKSVFGDALKVSYQSLHTHESLTGIEYIEEVPVMHVYFEGEDE
jgi:hypothetical protein